MRDTNVLSLGKIVETATWPGVNVDQLDEYFRQLNAFNVSIYPEDVAEAIPLLTGSPSARISDAAFSVDGVLSMVYLC
jgi:hypothetical protein